MHATNSSSAPRLGVLLLVVAAKFLMACGGASSGKLMVDSPIYQFQAPEESDLVEDSDDAGAETGGQE